NVEVGADAILGSADQGDGMLEAILDRARAGLAAEMLGHAMQSFDVTLDYLKTRVQFGQVIGTFQALQHRAAKMFTDLELARSASKGRCRRSIATPTMWRNSPRWRKPRSAISSISSRTRWSRCMAASA